MTKTEELLAYLEQSGMTLYHATLHDLSGVSWKKSGPIVYHKREGDDLLKFNIEPLPEDIANDILVDLTTPRKGELISPDTFF